MPARPGIKQVRQGILERMRRQRRRAQDLRLAIDCLPTRTRAGDAGRASTRTSIIVGAYTDRRRRRLPDARGAPPTAAAPRSPASRAPGTATPAPNGRAPGDRPRAAHAARHARGLADQRGRPRRDGRRGRRPQGGQGAPCARGRPSARRPSRRDTGERDRTPELRKRHGWAWLRIFRRYDTYKAALDAARGGETQRPRARARARQQLNLRGAHRRRRPAGLRRRSPTGAARQPVLRGQHRAARRDLARPRTGRSSSSATTPTRTARRCAPGSPATTSSRSCGASPTCS